MNHTAVAVAGQRHSAGSSRTGAADGGYAAGADCATPATIRADGLPAPSRGGRGRGGGAAQAWMEEARLQEVQGGSNLDAAGGDDVDDDGHACALGMVSSYEFCQLKNPIQPTPF